MRQYLWRILGRRGSEPRVFPTSGFEVIHESVKVEEERLQKYKPEDFYPVKIGQVFKSRYQVVGKLGYGTTATLWLCRDLKRHKYVTIKVFKHGCRDAGNEVNAFLHLDRVKKGTKHPGSVLTRTALKTFLLSGPAGYHQCLVHDPLGITLSRLMRSCPSQRLPKLWLRLALQQILLTLDFLHSEAQVVHTDLHLANFLLVISEESVLSVYEKVEMIYPSPRKVLGDRTIYRSRDLPYAQRNGPPTLIDFGKAHLGESRGGIIQASAYRAPEVMLHMPWNCKAEIWNLGAMAWNLFEGKHLFDCPGDDEEVQRLARMIAILGPPSKEFLERSDATLAYFNEDGEWSADEEIPDATLEDLESNLHGQEKAQFLQFIRKMLQWEPEKRQSAKELLEDPWLKGEGERESSASASPPNAGLGAS